MVQTYDLMCVSFNEGDQFGKECTVMCGQCIVMFLHYCKRSVCCYIEIFGPVYDTAEALINTVHKPVAIQPVMLPHMVKHLLEYRRQYIMITG